MATSQMARPTILDWARRSDPDGSLAEIAEVLNESNPIVQDMPIYTSNAPLGNQSTIRSSLPSVGFSRINQGATRSKGNTRQVVDTIGMLVAMSEVDAKLADVVSDFQAKRASDDAAFVEAFSQAVANQIINGNEATEGCGFTGLNYRMAALQTSAYTTSYVKDFDSGSDSDLTSIYFVDWGKRGVFGICPQNTVGGLQQKDLGLQRVLDADSNPLMAYVSEYKWYVGLAVADARHMARLCNIAIADVLADTDGSEGYLVDAMTEVMNAMASRAGMQRVAYCNRVVHQALWKQVMAKSNLTISIQEYLGEFRPSVLGVPLVQVDQISKTEARIS